MTSASTGPALLAVAFLAAGCAPCDGEALTVVGADGATHLEACVEVADTAAARRAGLAGRDALEEGGGLLLAFPHQDEICITGEGMRFPLDVIFIDAERAVTSVDSLAMGAAPICRPRTAWVVELGAGDARAVRQGDTLIEP